MSHAHDDHDGGHDAHDPHLREALRHAPDAQVQAPAALGELILKEARAQARAAKPEATGAAAPPAWAMRLWDWLARPALATGFAGVLAATLVGLMWWDRPMDEAAPRAPAPARVSAPAAAPAPPASPAPAAQPPERAPLAVQTEPTHEGAAGPRKAEPARKAAPRAAVGAPGATTATGSVAREAAAPADSNKAEAAVDRATARVASEPPPPAAPAAAYAAGPASASAAHPADLSLTSQAPIDRAARDRLPAAAKPQFAESRVQLEAEAYTRVASLRAAIAAEPARWTWQRSGGTPQPMNEAVPAWLAQVDASAGTRWQAAASTESAASHGRALLLLRDGKLQHRLQFTAQGLSWQQGSTPWRLDLPAETRAPLEAALERAAP